MPEPIMGIRTWKAEGNSNPNSQYFSRRAHVPSAKSGVTIGRGYDMLHRDISKVKSTLLRAGVSLKHAELLSKGGRKKSPDTYAFIQRKEIQEIVISEKAEIKLFEEIYAIKYKSARRMCMKDDVQDLYGKCEWNTFPDELVELITDLTFRGDYTGIESSNTRGYLQTPIVKRDWAALKLALKKIPGATKIQSRTDMRLELVDIIIRNERLKICDPIENSIKNGKPLHWYDYSCWDHTKQFY